KKEEEKDSIDIVEILKSMRSEQTEVVSDAISLHGKMDPEKKIGFRHKRQIGALDSAEKKMLHQLRSKAYPALEKAKQQIAIWGLKRVETSIELSHKHLATPALGERGVELCKVVLREIDRLLEIVEKLPKPKKSEEAAGGGGGGGGAAPPFPPMAQLNLLAQGQELVMHHTMARYGQKLSTDQDELGSMISQMLTGVRPGTRPEILLKRVAQAMTGASQRLKLEDMGVHTQHQQRLAVLSLQQIMREAKSQQGSGKGKPKNNKKQQGDKQKQASKGSSSGSSSGKSAQASGGENNAKGKKQLAKEIQAVIEQRGDAWFMNLPPKVRQGLIEVNIQELPPGAQELYRRYLEVLEDVKE
ncbi:MAG: hypothetical protein HRU15_05470, partial [Planctomycetes bacterium]|nr:hypothetical protein [Planctomycetota bacterium]